MKAYSLFSGSKGNCIFICSDKASVLIDCGVSERRTRYSVEALGRKMEDIDAIFITHEHIDHVSGLKMIEKKHSIPVHLTEESARCIVCEAKDLENMYIHDSEYSVCIKDLEISSFLLSHDSECAVGYIVKDNTTGHTLGIATDTGCVTKGMKDKMCGCDTVILESNHDVVMLKTGSYPADLKRRISGKHGHLSNDDAAEFASFLAENGTKRILLFHLSEENNTPELAIKTVKSAINNDDVIVMAADKDETVEIL